MITQNFINQHIKALQPTDSIHTALQQMNRFHLQHLPVVDQDGAYSNLIEEYDIWEHQEQHKQIGSIPISTELSFVTDEAPIQDVLKILIKKRLSLVPVLDNQNNYLGVITLESVLDHFAQANALYDPGGIIVLEMPAHSYSLAEIARAIESNHARILNSHITTTPDESMVEVTLKVNHTDLTFILATLERRGYVVKDSHSETNDYYQEAQENFDAFMNYLQM
jgi:CBS domain-containing protein